MIFFPYSCEPGRKKICTVICLFLLYNISFFLAESSAPLTMPAVNTCYSIKIYSIRVLERKSVVVVVVSEQFFSIAN